MEEEKKEFAYPVGVKMVGQDYTLTQKVLGEGQFGKVILARSALPNDNVKGMRKRQYEGVESEILWMACKVLSRSKVDDAQLVRIKDEVNTMNQTNSKSVTTVYDWVATPSNFYIFMQYCNGGDLANFVQSRGPLTQEEARLIIRDIVAGFVVLNQNGFVHRDLKLTNIMLHFNQIDEKIAIEAGDKFDDYIQKVDITKPGVVDVRICDFGLSRQLDDDELAQSCVGTPLYMAPETIMGEGYDSKADVWALGSILYELLAGIKPFHARSREELCRKLNEGNFYVPKELRLSMKTLDFLQSCLKYEASERKSWTELAQHPFLTDEGVEENEELMLSISYQEGAFALAKQFDKPHDLLNSLNSYLLNTKDFQKYEELKKKKMQQMAAKLEEKDALEKYKESKVMDSGVNATSSFAESESLLEPEFIQFEDILDQSTYSRALPTTKSSTIAESSEKKEEHKEIENEKKEVNEDEATVKISGSGLVIKDGHF